ncbi:hypothetical protein HNQ56_003129 [Anaerotaenia torta]|uniref:hypothetical protein n=1 Tax=Anaerotaenia torta TaxID=433293 RepID=UPI003D2625D1
MKVGILTMFGGLATIYSLVNVVAEHIRMLLEAGIEVKLLVCEDLPDSEKHGIYLDPRIEWAKVCNRYRGEQIHWRDYSSPDTPIHPELLEEAAAVGADLTEKLKDVTVCMMHDIHYQGWHLLHNIAVRYAAERLPRLKFIAVTHSLPDESGYGRDIPWPHSARYSPMRNTIYTYPTECGLPSLARQYHVKLKRCRVLNNTLDLMGHMSAQVQELHSRTDLISPDLLIIYPARFTIGKKFEKVAMLGGAIKKVSGYSVKIIFCEFEAMDTDMQDYKRYVAEAGTASGLDREDMVFISDYGYPMGLTRDSVLDLFSLSNLFICPSVSESFGLTALEAAAMGNYLVLNECVPALKELGDTLQAYFMRWDASNFGFYTTETYHPSEQAYYEEHGQRIIEEMLKNPVVQARMQARKRYSPRWVFEHQLKKLL